MSGIRGKRYINEKGEEVLTGGLKAAETNKKKYGNGFYARIGAKGGRNGRGEGYKGGFAANPELARKVGAKGGKLSKREIGNHTVKWKKIKDDVIRDYETNEYSMLQLAAKYEIHYSTLRKGLKEEGF